MLKKIAFTVVLTIFTVLWGLTHPAQSAEADPFVAFTYLTEEFRPYNYKEKGRAAGLAVDLLRLVWHELDVPEQPIHFMPWPRAYDATISEQGTILFSTLRTPEREHLFKWAGPITLSRTYLVARADNPISMHSIEDLKGLSVGVVRDYASEIMLSKHSHLASIQTMNSVQTCIKMLASGRLDLISLEEKTFSEALHCAGIDSGDFKNVWLLNETRSYYAFNKEAPDRLVARFQKALDTLITSPHYDALMKYYLD